ncbi:MAG TPA: hypothetical protein VFI65_12925 [Streptosporangiaceae bacterium]|nr:hypothetical protein [Streptosporangiaceae bacterium]
MAPLPGVGCDPGVGWAPVPVPDVGAEPGVGELVLDPAAAGVVDPESVGVSVGVPGSVGVGLLLGVPLDDGDPDGVVLGVPDGGQLVVVVGPGPPPGWPPFWPDGPPEPLPDVVKPGVVGLLG